jgi:hypothetical protein
MTQFRMILNNSKKAPLRPIKITTEARMISGEKTIQRLSPGIINFMQNSTSANANAIPKMIL